MSCTTPITTNSLINFYDPSLQARDFKNRTLSQILSWTDDKFEYHHDYVQILFPLPEGSPFNPSAPIIDKATFLAFRSRPELRSNLQKSLVRMLHFYGFQFERDGTIVTGTNFSTASKNWVKRFNHNHLRITRIIRSLRVLGLEVEAAELFKALESVYGQYERIGERSMIYWRRAAKRPLSVAPEKDEDDGKGAEFLYEFEKDRKGEKKK